MVFIANLKHKTSCKNHSNANEEGVKIITDFERKSVLRL